MFFSSFRSVKYPIIDVRGVFKAYPVHIGGQEGILEAMHCQVQVKNVKVYLLLYELRNIRNFNWSWLHIDLRAAKYEPLLEKLGQKEFREYF